MFDIFGKIKILFEKKEILNDDPQEIARQDTSTQSYADEDEIAQAFIDHINEIENWKDRIAALDYLSQQAAKKVGTLEYTTDDENMINMISSLGGSGNKVDFELFQKCMFLTLEWYNKLALQAIASRK